MSWPTVCEIYSNPVSIPKYTIRGAALSYRRQQLNKLFSQLWVPFWILMLFTQSLPCLRFLRKDKAAKAKNNTEERRLICQCSLSVGLFLRSDWRAKHVGIQALAGLGEAKCTNMGKSWRSCTSQLGMTFPILFVGSDRLFIHQKGKP